MGDVEVVQASPSGCSMPKQSTPGGGKKNRGRGRQAGLVAQQPGHTPTPVNSESGRDGKSSPSAPLKTDALRNQEVEKKTDEAKSEHGSTPVEPPTASSAGTAQKSKAERKAEFLEKQQQKKKLDNVDAQVASPVTEQSSAPAEGTAQKSKAQLRAERREKQESQRAAKAVKKPDTPSTSAVKKEQAPVVAKRDQPGVVVKKDSATVVTKKEPARVPDNVQADDPTVQKRVAKRLVKQQVPQRDFVQRTVRLFNHLPQYASGDRLTENLSFHSSKIHPAIIKLGVQYSSGVVYGSNARCLALLSVLAKVIQDYTTPPQKELSRELESKLKPNISFLNQCRPISVSMGNLIKNLKTQISQVPLGTPDLEAKAKLLAYLSTFRENIEQAGEAVAMYTLPKIKDGDVILVYASSSLIQKVLLNAHLKKRQFHVIVVDGRPRNEGREQLRKLRKWGIHCSFVDCVAAHHMIKQATKVLLGAHALLANGYVMSRVGSSAIALAARDYNVPVLVCCETYKFYDRVQTDAFVFNELANPNVLVDIPVRPRILGDWENLKSLVLLNLTYDVTPPEFVSAVITELGMIPCTSVPVVLRVQQGESEC